MAVKFQEQGIAFTDVNRTYTISFDDTNDNSASPSNIQIANIRGQSGSSGRGQTEVIVSQAANSGWEVEILAGRGEGLIEFLEGVKKGQVRCHIDEDGVRILDGFVVPGSIRTALNSYKQEIVSIQCIDGFKYLDNIPFTLDDFTAIREYFSKRSKTFAAAVADQYTDSAQYIRASDFVMAAIHKATGSYHPVGVASDIAFYIDSALLLGYNTPIENGTELLTRLALPVGPLFGKTWGAILNEDITGKYNMRFNTYRNKFAFTNIPKFRGDSYDIDFINADGLAKGVNAFGDDASNNNIPSETITALEIDGNLSHASSRVFGTDELNTINVRSYRGFNANTIELSDDRLINGDIELSGVDMADGWGEVVVRGTHDSFTFLNSGGRQTTDDEGETVGNTNRLLYKVQVSHLTANTWRNNANDIQRYRYTDSEPIGSVRFSADELGALLQYYILTDGYSGYSISNTPLVHNLILLFIELDESNRGEQVETGNIWSYDVGRRTWHKIGEGRWAVGTVGIVNDIDTPFTTTWDLISRRIYNLPSYGKLRVMVSNPFTAQNFTTAATYDADCYWDSFQLLERIPVQGSQSGVVRSVSRNDIEGEYVYDSPVFGSTTAIGSQYNGEVKIWDAFGKTNRSALGWKDGLYSVGEVSKHVSDPGNANLEYIIAKQLLEQTSSSKTLIDLDISLSSIGKIDPRKPIKMNGRYYVIRQLREDVGNNRARITLVEVGHTGLDFVQTETIEEQATGGGVRTTVQFADGAPGQNLTDAEIGSKAFRNVPNDLSENEKTVVRNRIGAGTGSSTAQTQVQADWTETDSTDVSFIRNKPQTLTANERTKLAGIQANAEVNVQADYEETDTTADSFILNKPAVQTYPAIVFNVAYTAGFSTGSTTQRLSDDDIEKITGENFIIRVGSWANNRGADSDPVSILAYEIIDKTDPADASNPGTIRMALVFDEGFELPDLPQNALSVKNIRLLPVGYTNARNDAYILFDRENTAVEDLPLRDGTVTTYPETK